MKTQTQHIREHLLACLGYTAPAVRMPSLSQLTATEWSPRFEQLMRNRLLMGAFRYGQFADGAETKAPYDLVGAVRRKIGSYAETGNTEYLVDAANYLLLEFEFGQHPSRHFHARDDHDHCPKKTTPPSAEGDIAGPACR